MGYTHYWARPRVLLRPPFVAAVEHCRRLCAALNIPLGDAHGQGCPTFTATEICFNGHVDGSRLTSVQRVGGMVWPNQDAHGVAVVGEPDAVVGGWGTGPAVTARVLGPNDDGSYETFRVVHVQPHQHATQNWCNEYCKTNYRPYDLCVQACLIILSHHFGNKRFQVTSDGDSRDWNDARDACQHILGYGIDWGEDKLAPVSPPTPPNSPWPIRSSKARLIAASSSFCHQSCRCLPNWRSCSR